MNNIYKFTAPIVVLVLVALGVFYYANQKKDLYVAFTPSINQVQENAFGSLLNQDGKGDLADTVGSFGSQELAPTSVLEIDESILQKSIGYTAGGGTAESLIYPGPRNFKYVYTGDDFSLDDTDVSVLRRIKGSGVSKIVSDQLSALDFGVFDIGSFDTKIVQNLSFLEDKEFGYSVNIDFTDGMISIIENWQKWEHPFNNCTDQKCRDNLKLKEGDIPSDKELVKIANTFLQDRKISTAPYGEPFVDKEWRKYYDEQFDLEHAIDLYIPDSFQVKYPLVVNNEEVFEQGGENVALTINVNIRFNRVSSIWGLTSQQYESSNYKAETNPQKIIQIAEAGGLYGYLLPAKDAIEINLGTPKRVLMRQWNWNKGVNNELLVPALMFPVVVAPNEVPYYQRRSITIPLAQELLVRDNGGVIYLERAEDVSLPPVLDVGEGDDAPL